MVSLGRERPPSKTKNVRTKDLTVKSDIEKQRHSSRTTIGQTLSYVTMKKENGGDEIRIRNLEMMPTWK